MPRVIPHNVHFQDWLETNWTEVRMNFYIVNHQIDRVTYVAAHEWCIEHVGEEYQDYATVGSQRWYFARPEDALLFKLTCG